MRQSCGSQALLENQGASTTDEIGSDAAGLRALNMVSAVPRMDWKKEEIAAIFNAPLLELIFAAAKVHRECHDSTAVQQCTLLSIKTGGCSEDCSYCPQSARYDTGVKAEKLLDPEAVYAAAQCAKNAGSTRFCMGAAWREARDNNQFDQVLDIVRKVKSLDMEVCVTLGMLGPDEARRLKEAGVTAYNHNLDTGEEFYDKIITTRTYQDRLDTINNVRDAGMSVCCGGIVGLGETPADRVDLLHTLATMREHPESVPVNALVRVEGTPLADQPQVEIWEMLRMIATARIVMPRARVRLSAGRLQMSHAEQALCFLAGASSIFTGEKLLTTGNPGYDEDREMFQILGLKTLSTPKESTCC
ncbi:MAG: biotin synthase BioB [Candidatus Obscuribacterales bacterium]|nr:biotin synthase BioB [Candidatus Obscuribacterales bacterium]